MALLHVGIVGVVVFSITFVLGLLMYRWPRKKTDMHRNMGGALMAASFSLTFLYGLLIAGLGVMTRLDGVTIFPVRFLVLFWVLLVDVWSTGKFFWMTKWQVKSMIFWAIIGSLALFGSTVDPNAPTRWGLLFVFSAIAWGIWVLLFLRRYRNTGWADWMMFLLVIVSIAVYVVFWGIGPGSGLAGIELIQWLFLATDGVLFGLLGICKAWRYECPPPKRDNMCREMPC